MNISDPIKNDSNIMSFDIKKRAFIELEIKEDSDKYYHIEGYASTFGNIDRHSDVIVKGAYENTLRVRKPKLLWQHKMDEPIGTIETIYEDERGLYMVAKLPKENTDVKNIFSLIEAGAVSDFSVGFNAIQTEMEEETGVRMIKEVDLWEVSLVTIPANPLAKVLSFKAATPLKNYDIASRDRSWDSNEAIKRIRSYTDSQESPSAEYKNFFLWYDADNTENFSGYKLPFADIVNGEPQIVVNAVVAAKAALAGARGGVDIPDADKTKIMRNVDKYLSRAGLDEGKDIGFLPSTAKGIYTMDEVGDIKTKREYEKLLRDVGFSKKSAKYLASNSNFIDSEVWEKQGLVKENASETIKVLMREMDSLKKSIKG